MYSVCGEIAKEEGQDEAFIQTTDVSWFDSYDIYDENENTVYVVKGQLSWGHCLKIFDTEENELVLSSRKC